MSEVRQFASDEICRISFFRSLAVVDVAGYLDEPHMRTIEEALLQLQRDGGGEVGVLAVVRGSAPIPGAEARSYAAHVIKTHGAWLKLIAVVVEDSGIVTQLFTSLVRSINFIAKRAGIKVFPSLMAAEQALVEALFPWTVRALTLSEFRAAVREVRSDFAPSRPGSAA